MYFSHISETMGIHTKTCEIQFAQKSNFMKNTRNLQIIFKYPDVSFFENHVDPDQLAFDKTI